MSEGFLYKPGITLRLMAQTFSQLLTIAVAMCRAAQVAVECDGMCPVFQFLFFCSLSRSVKYKCLHFHLINVYL
jgi:hypothetical protein